MRPTVAEIDLQAIAFNFTKIQNRVKPARVMAVVKADAYGHGLIPVARKVIELGCSHLAVATVDEGMALRQQQITAPVLVFGGLLPEQASLYLDYDLQATVFSPSVLQALEQAAQLAGKPAQAQVLVDTGMGRVGIHWQSALTLIQQAAWAKWVNLTGVYTHFATSDEHDKTYARLQLHQFNTVLDQAAEAGIRIPLRHAANSGAILDLPESYFDLVRPGISLYGYYPSSETSRDLPLRPAMTLKTKIFYIKEISPGTSISYGRKFIARHRTRIATLPIGYADGYNRLLTNKGYVSIHNQVYPVVGTVTMDQIMVDIGITDNIQVGDEAILFGPDGDERVSVYQVCQTIGTIPYEVTCWVSKRVPRVYRHQFNQPFDQ